MKDCSRLDALRRCLALSVAATLAACGGGGDAAPGQDNPPLAGPPSGSPSGPPSAPPPPSPPPPSPPPAPAAAGTRATCNLPDFQAEAMRLVNAHRAAGASCGAEGSFAAVEALAWNAPSTQAALGHSDDMVANNFTSHTGSNGSSAGARATAAGYVWSTWGENIAAGQPTVADVVAAWMASDGHCANVMNPAFRDIGLACVAGGAGNRYGTYWTMALGAAR